MLLEMGAPNEIALQYEHLLVHGPPSGIVLIYRPVSAVFSSCLVH
jgi:hypothetical protein